MGVVLKNILQEHSQVSQAGSNTVKYGVPQAVGRHVNSSSGQSKQVISGMSCSSAAACLELLPPASTGNVVEYHISGRVPEAAGHWVQDISGVLVQQMQRDLYLQGTAS